MGDGREHFFGRRGGLKMSLCVLNLIYIRVSEQKCEVVNNMGSWVKGDWVWDFHWSRNLLPRGLSSLNLLQGYLQSFRPTRDSKDGWRWAHSPSGLYITSNVYKILLH